MKNLKSTNLQLIGFFGTKKPIICKIVDSAHSSVNFILETVPHSLNTAYKPLLLNEYPFLFAPYVI